MKTIKVYQMIGLLVIFILALNLVAVVPSAAQTGQGDQQDQQEYEQVQIEINQDGIEIPGGLPYGTVILWITNSDTVEHNFRIQGPGLDRQFLTPIQIGQTKTLRVDLMEGSYSLSTLDEGGAAGMSIDVPVSQGQQGEQGGEQEGQQTPSPEAGGEQGEQEQPTASPEAGDQQGEQGQTTPIPQTGGEDQQAQATPTEQAGDQDQQATPTQQPGDQDQQATPTQQAGQDQQATPTQQAGGQDQQETPTPQDGDQEGEAEEGSQVPVTGGHEGFRVAEVAQPGQSGEINLDIQLVKVAEGFVDPVNVVASPDDTGRLFVVERNGVVSIVQDGQVSEQPFLDLSEETLDAFLEQGLYDLEFHPDFATNGRFYIHFAELLRNGDSMIVEYTVSDDDPDVANPDSARVIMQIEQPWANHNGGELAFGPDGYLYIGSGDGGWEGDPLEAGQDLSTLLGKVLRIDVNTDGQAAYRIPEDNPYAGEAGLVQLFNIEEETFAQIHTEARPEIWAWGLRNPWKFQFDPETGDLYLPDVGQNHWEEINFQPADSPGGENYGWDFLMGSYCFPINADSCEPIGVLPVAEYDHDQGNAVVGVGVYRGDEFSEMDGIYFVADWGSGKIWGLQRGDDGSWVFDELLDTGTRLTGSGQDAEGNLYVTSCNCTYDSLNAEDNLPGALWRIVPADQVQEGDETAPLDAPDDQQDQEGEQPQQTPTPADGDQQGQMTQTPSPEDGDQDGGQEGQQTQTPQAGQDEGEDGDQEGGGDEALIQQGQEVFSSECARCHGQNGEGQVGPPLAGNQDVTSEDPAPVIDIVLHGRGVMPGFQDQLDNEQIAAVVSYIRNSWGNQAPTVSPEEVDGGQGMLGGPDALVRQGGEPLKGSLCTTCHLEASHPVVAGQDPRAASSVVRYLSFFSAAGE